MALPVSLGGWAGVQGRALVAGQRLGKAASRTVQLPVSCQNAGKDTGSVGTEVLLQNRSLNPLSLPPAGAILSGHILEIVFPL